VSIPKKIKMTDLPTTLSDLQAVELCYRDQIELAVHRLCQGYRVLIRCEKGLNSYLYPALRRRIKKSEEEWTVTLIDGRNQQEEPGMNRTQTMLNQIAQFMRGGVSSREIAFMTHLDILSTTQSALTPETKEVIPLLYEHPQAQFCALVDPSFPLPKSLIDVFDLHLELGGVQRVHLPSMVTQREARAIHHQYLDPYVLYPYISGLSALKARRLLSTLRLRAEATPLREQSSREALRSLREQTASGIDGIELPQVDLHKDIAGYDSLKHRVQSELIELALASSTLDDPEEIELAESLTPKGILFYGPPGTGKTYFAKAIATSLQATLLVVSGPELKSKWVGESEENVRRIFRKARASAPSVIVFDEIDSFAQARGSYQSAGVEHSMVNQLLTEMDGFRSNEQIFVMGTTNFLASVDHALLRPGRFELLIEVPAPDLETRVEIIKYYDQSFKLGISSALIRWMGEQTNSAADPMGNPYSADHLKALCRALKREQLLHKGQEIKEGDILDIMNRDLPPITLTEEERRVIATHECGHAVISVLLPRTSSPSRVSIRPDMMSLGRVHHSQNRSQFIYTPTDFREDICVLLGGLVAEEIFFGEYTVGASQDLAQATAILRNMAAKYGMSPIGLASWERNRSSQGRSQLDLSESSDHLRTQTELWIQSELEEGKKRATDLLKANQSIFLGLVDRLLTLNELTLSDLTSAGLVVE
jgi:cell division protease FtsH